MDIFNIESCEGTEELESSLQNQMIGSTMYDKRWVLNLIFSIGGSSSKGLQSSLQDNLRQDLSALSEMSVDPDVSEFLFSSGSLHILWNGIQDCEDESLQEHISLILFNCGSNDKVLSGLLPLDQYFLVPFLMIKCESPPFLINIFRYLRLLLDKLLSLFEEDTQEFGSRMVILENLISERSYTQQLRFIFSSSSNDQLLLRAGLFLLSLTELFCESGREESVEMVFSEPDFILSFFEALKQSIKPKENRDTMFVYIELLGHYCNVDNLEPIASELCASLFGLLDDYVQECCRFSPEDLDMIGTLLKIFATSWNTVLHKDSFFALSQLSEKMEARPCERYLALIQNINNCLDRFRDKFPS